MKKFLITSLVGATILGGSNLIASATTETTQDTTNTNTQQTSMEQLQSIQDKLNDGVDDKVVIEELKVLLPQLIKENEPVIGSNVEQVGLWLQLQQAEKDIEEFGSYINTIDLEKYQPMSEEELKSIGIE